MNRHSMLLAAAVLAAAAGGVQAEDLSASPDLVTGTVDGHAYRNGGIGDAEAAQMRQDLRDYNLQLAFSEGKHNAWLADVQLDVFDASGRNVFSLNEAGPLVDVQLPAGRYRVVARAGGIERTGSAEVAPGRPARLYLHWREVPAAM
jgi:hypothetical protein